MKKFIFRFDLTFHFFLLTYALKEAIMEYSESSDECQCFNIHEELNALRLEGRHIFES